MLRYVNGPLFQPYFLGSLRLPNRIVMAPMARDRAGEQGIPGLLEIEYFRQRATAGLIIAGGAHVSPCGVGAWGIAGIHTQDQMLGWRRVAQAVHEAGGRIFLQLWHAGRLSHPDLLGGRRPVGPSPLAAPGEAMTPKGMQAYPIPRELETHEIPSLVEEYARAAAYAKSAGFDGVEVNAANGHLLDQFLRDGSNQREDEYGGSPLRRMRFLFEVLEAVSTVWDSDRVGVRVAPEYSANGMSDSHPEVTFGELATELGRFDLAYLHVVRKFDAPAVNSLESSGNSPYIEEDSLSHRMRENFRGPFLLCGGLTPRTAHAALQLDSADLVAFGRAFLANPDLPLRISTHAELNSLNRDTLFAGGAEGMIDYPSLSASVSHSAREIQ